MNTGEIILLILGVIIIVVVPKGKSLWLWMKEIPSWMKEKERLLTYLAFGMMGTLFLIGIAMSFGPVCTVSFLIIVGSFMVIMWEVNTQNGS